MANTHADLNSLFTAIADAIREKTNSAEEIVADNFPTEIENLRTGFDYSNQSVTAIPDYAFYGCEELNNVDCYNVTSIGESAFENCKNLKSVTLYEGVESVGTNAFKGCGDVEINCMLDEQPETWDENWNPDGSDVVWVGAPIETWDISATENDSVIAKLYNDVKNDGMYLLVICGYGNMKDFATKNGYTTTINRPWDGLQIRAVIVCDGIANLGSYAFRGYSSLTSVTIGDSVTSIGDDAFRSCTSLTSVTIGNSVTSIGNYAFEHCESLTSINIPDSIINIQRNAFSYCIRLTSITIPDSVTTIGLDAFYYCTSLTSVTIPDSVTSIGYGTFDGCSSLTSIHIPDSVTTIGYYAFDGCSSLTSITYTGTIAQWNAITFVDKWNSDTGNYTIHCTDGDIAKDGTITYHTTT